MRPPLEIGARKPHLSSYAPLLLLSFFSTPTAKNIIKQNWWYRRLFFENKYIEDPTPQTFGHFLLLVVRFVVVGGV